MEETELKRRQKGKFTTIENIFINDVKLSYGAKGVYIYLISKPENWHFYLDNISAKSNETKGKIKKYVKELENNNYIFRYKTTKEGTNKLIWVWEIIEGTELERAEKVNNLKLEIKQKYDNRKLRQCKITTMQNYDNRKTNAYNNTETTSNTNITTNNNTETTNNTNNKDIDLENNNKPPLSPLKQKGEINLDFILPEHLEIFSLWLDYKKEKGQRYKGETSIKICYNKLVKLSGGSVEKMREIVENSIMCNYAGLFPLSEPKKATGGNFDKKSNGIDYNRDFDPHKYDEFK